MNDDPSPDLARIALAVGACPAVLGLHPGARKTICTRTEQGRIAGLCLVGHVLVVGVAVNADATITAIDRQVVAAVSAHAPHLYVAVVVIDGAVAPPERSDDNAHG